MARNDPQGSGPDSPTAGAAALSTPLAPSIPFGWRKFIPRPESVLLLLSLAWTLGAKLMVVRRQKPDSLLAAWAEVSLGDLAFFAAVSLFIAVVFLLPARRWGARIVLLPATAILGWSVANAAWLIATDVQLQPGILAVLLRDPLEFWPMVKTHLTRRLHFSVPIALTLLLGLIWLGWRVVRPVTPPTCRRRQARRAIAAGGAFGLALLGQVLVRPAARLGIAGDAMGFNSHWHALLASIAGGALTNQEEVHSRPLPHAGQRPIGLPKTPTAELPNVVLLLLESTPYPVTLGDRESGRTPTLARLATEGVEFRNTHVPVSQTTKAYWASLTGTTPDLASDYVEAVLVDEPYESLATILRRAGYRSGFFEVSKGTYECAAGLFSNLGFDWAWFRENLRDPSAHIGYLGADDFRLIGPAFEWVAGGSEPFLLTMITSISHDPYEVPAWFAQPKEKRHERYLQCIEYTDAFIARLCEELEKRGLAENTLLCVLGDHGVAFRGHDRYGRWIPYEEVVRVPWVIRWPRRVQAGQVVEWPCAQMDVTPTILSMIGFDISDAGFEGRDAMIPGDPARRLYFSSWHEDSPLGCVESGRKWIYWPYNDKLYTYDLVSDPGEISPQPVDTPDRQAIIDDLLAWQRGAQTAVHPRRFREKTVFTYWRAFSSGRTAWAYYVP